MKALATALVVIALLACCFGAWALGFPVSEREEWDQLAGIGLLFFALVVIVGD